MDEESGAASAGSSERSDVEAALGLPQAAVPGGAYAFVTPPRKVCSARKMGYPLRAYGRRRPSFAKDASASKKARLDLSALEKRMLRKVYTAIYEIISGGPSEEDQPLSRNPAWFAKNPRDPLAKIVGTLCGVGQDVVERVWKERREQSGVVKTAGRRGPGRKGPEEIGLGGEQPEHGTLYDALRHRILEVSPAARILCRPL